MQYTKRSIYFFWCLIFCFLKKLFWEKSTQSFFSANRFLKPWSKICVQAKQIRGHSLNIFSGAIHSLHRFSGAIHSFIHSIDQHLLKPRTIVSILAIFGVCKSDRGIFWRLVQVGSFTVQCMLLASKISARADGLLAFWLFVGVQLGDPGGVGRDLLLYVKFASALYVQGSGGGGGVTFNLLSISMFAFLSGALVYCFGGHMPLLPSPGWRLLDLINLVTPIRALFDLCLSHRYVFGTQTRWTKPEEMVLPAAVPGSNGSNASVCRFWLILLW